MGYIAPNLWPTLDYGQALRRLVVEGRHLARWIDFRSHQVFEEATIYTAIQIFSAAPNDHVQVAFARDGDLGKVDWAAPDAAIGYDELDAEGGAWLLAPAAVRGLLNRLWADCRRLDDPAVTSAIFQGLITSADHIYHLEKRADGRYLRPARSAGGRTLPALEVDLEDEIMKPLVSGAEAKRFMAPSTATYVLFPYSLADGTAKLLDPDVLEARFPKAWAWLRQNEAELRARESTSFDDAQWYRFGRNQNLDKQEVPKLIVPRLVPALRLSIDPAGEVYCDNVDVGGVVPTEAGDLHYLAGILGSPTSDLLFRWLSKPFRGDYLSANKQFIAPLPVPSANPDQHRRVSNFAERLQVGYTERRRLRRGLSERLDSLARRRKPLEWLLPDVRSKQHIEESLINKLPGPAARRDQADKLQVEQVEAALARVEDMIRLDSSFEARLRDGELMLLIDGAPAAFGVYADEEQGAFWLAQWQVVAMGFEPNGGPNAKRLIDQLRTVADEAPLALRTQIIERQQALSRLAADLKQLEQDLHEITCRLFGLTPAERRMVEFR
jgi:hypothetical protein